jgi:predicted nucleic acid-binding protein
LSQGSLVGPTSLVLDTSVAAKWYVPEELREEALELSARIGNCEVDLLAPSTIGPELFNAFFQQHRRGHLSLDEVREFFSSFTDAPISFFEIDPLTPRAVEIALESGVIVYDALFLALAEEAGTVVVTADDKLLREPHGMPYSRLAHPLAGLDSLISGAG